MSESGRISDPVPGAAPRPPVRPPEEFLVFGAPLIGPEERAEVLACLESGWLGTGPRVAAFEQEFRQYLDAGHAVAVHSCTAALHLSLLAAGLGAGDEVITTALTFPASVNPILHVGATPVLADVDPLTMNLDPGRVEERITPRTRAILPVHFAGSACDMAALMAMAGRHGLRVIEDCAHAIETTIGDQHVGTIGDFGCYSFYATKNLATGEGGMIVTADPEAARRLRSLSLHGLSRDAWNRFGAEGYRHYHAVEPGFKYNMMDLQAAIGIHQLRRLEANWQRRRAVWQAYLEAFADLPLDLPGAPRPGTRHAYHLFTVLVDERRTGIARDRFLEAMTRENIGVGVHYRSIPTHPAYRDRWRPEDYPVSHRIGEQTVSLPLSARLTDRDVADVIAAVRRVLRA